jgi:hypothetical protein
LATGPSPVVFGLYLSGICPHSRRDVDAVFLGFEERQPLVNEDIPLPFGLPAVEQRLAQRRVAVDADG